MSSNSLRTAIAVSFACALAASASGQGSDVASSPDAPGPRILAILQTPQTAAYPPNFVALSSKLELVQRPKELPVQTKLALDCGGSMIAIQGSGRMWHSKDGTAWDAILDCGKRPCIEHLTSATFSPQTNCVYLVSRKDEGYIYRFSHKNQSLTPFITLKGEDVGAIAFDSASSTLTAIYVAEGTDMYGLVAFDLTGKELNRRTHKDKELSEMLAVAPSDITSALTMVVSGESLLLIAVDDKKIPKSFKLFCYRHNTKNLAYSGRETVTVDLMR